MKDELTRISNTLQDFADTGITPFPVSTPEPDICSLFGILAALVAEVYGADSDEDRAMDEVALTTLDSLNETKREYGIV